jgi:hypothetical protein
MMKRPSLCLIRRRCLPLTGVAPNYLRRNGSPNSADGRPLSRLKAAATGGKSQAVAGRPELRWPFVGHVGNTLGALSP